MSYNQSWYHLQHFPSLAINPKVMAMGGPLRINQGTLVTPSSPHKESYLQYVINWREIMAGLCDIFFPSPLGRKR